MIGHGLLRLFLFLFYRLFKDDLFLVAKAKTLKRLHSPELDKELELTFKVLRKISGILPVSNKCFILSLTMFSLCGEGAVLFFGVAPGDIENPSCHAWVQWDDMVFNSDYGFQGSVMWTHSK